MISGGIKFFEKIKNLAQDGSVITASNGEASADRALDRNPYTYYRSVSSNDLDTITLTITLPSAMSFNRLFLVDHNWKEFTAKWLNGASYDDFSNITGIDGVVGSIAPAAFADDTAYYEFGTVTTTSIQLTVTKTQVADAEKYINQIILTTELGTLEGYPEIKDVEHSRNPQKKEVLSGKKLTLKSEASVRIGLQFKDYPRRLSDDVDLMFELADSEVPFLIWMCGGRRGSTYFGKQLKGFRLKDVYLVQTSNDMKPDYSKNVYKNGVNFSITFEEEAT